ncbi:glutamyl-tRNA reductase [Haloplanus halophilus]|uniref:glutamyl-tRNA reductase n=1 Tax=Haloplanus halophilus TaxID=2949993 RepID=UPI0020419EAA|nr:glutamyl-tRNA reductase [Haloplanus sp. GDY1]
MTTGVISGVTVSHRRATVDEIESAADDDESTAVRDLLASDGVDEAFALQTCNRAEAYVVTEDAAAGRAALAAFAPEVRDGAVRELDHEASLRHLMRVAAGLESLVLGEDQIIGQLRTAFETARGVGGIGPVLDPAITKALHVGERARTETTINEGVVSLGSAAVELATRERDLDGTTALVVGAGEMGRLAAQAFDDTGVSELVVANRTIPHATHLAEEVETAATGVGLDRAAAAAERADVLVTATDSPRYVLDRSALADAGETLVIDLAQPRDVDPAVADVDGVEAFDIDSLEAITDETRERRREAAETVERMIDEEFDRLIDSFKRRQADEAISAMYESAEMVKERELHTALSRLESQGGLTDEQRETVASLADALVGQLLAAPTESLRDAAAEDDWTTIQTALGLFDPEFGGDRSAPPSAETPREGMDEDIPQHVLDGLREE